MNKEEQLFGKEMSDNQVSLLTEADIPKLWEAINFMRGYALKAGFESENSDDILGAAASILPPIFSAKSKFARSDNRKPPN